MTKTLMQTLFCKCKYTFPMDTKASRCAARRVERKGSPHVRAMLNQSLLNNAAVFFAASVNSTEASIFSVAVEIRNMAGGRFGMRNGDRPENVNEQISHHFPRFVGRGDLGNTHPERIDNYIV